MPSTLRSERRQSTESRFENTVGLQPHFSVSCPFDGWRTGERATTLLCLAALDGRTHTHLTRIFNAVDDLMIRATTPVLDLFGAGLIYFAYLASPQHHFLVLLFFHLLSKRYPIRFTTLLFCLLLPKVIIIHIRYPGSTLVYSLFLLLVGSGDTYRLSTCLSAPRFLFYCLFLRASPGISQCCEVAGFTHTRIHIVYHGFTSTTLGTTHTHAQAHLSQQTIVSRQNA